eukprot:Nk52_evm64s745 gene=Nk52_evmTU64s745
MTVLDETEGGLAKNPNLELASHLFLLTSQTVDQQDRKGITAKVMAEIKEKNMYGFYSYFCEETGQAVDKALLSNMTKFGEDKVKAFDEKIEDAVKNLGETEIREANLEKSEFLCSVGDKEAALAAFDVTFEKTVSLGQRLDIVFNMIRIGIFYMDHKLITTQIERAKKLIDEGGDWDRRNRLKVYEATYAMSIRDFKKAALLFLDALATFTSYELMDYQKFVCYTVFCCSISLDRVELKKKVIKSPEVLEVLHTLPDISEYMNSLYECRYATFFKKLAIVESFFRHDRLLAVHCRYFVREMRIVAYAQLLESYRSLTLQSMADSFGVSVGFIDRELARFISAGRLNCKIDKVNNIVETNRPDSKNAQYQSAIKKGDILLNRIQKLSRVINI